MSDFAYGALGMGDDDAAPFSASPPTGTSLSSSSIALSFSDARLASSRSARDAFTSSTGALLGGGYNAPSSGGGRRDVGYQSSNVDKEALLGSLRSAGVGGLGTASFELDVRKLRWDKPSRLVRMQRGTKCYRFTLLFLSVLIVFSGYFQFDLPAITVNQILGKLNIDMEQYSTIFVGYSISNTIVPLFSGAFFGKFGKWRGVTVIAITITFGIAIVYIGMLAKSFPLVVVGRTVYGLGGESVFVGVDILVTKWFQGAEIGFAYGLIQAAGQAGSFTALYSVPPMITAFNGEVNSIYFISFLLSCSALACLALARLIEKTAYGAKKTKSAYVSGDDAIAAGFAAKANISAQPKDVVRSTHHGDERSSLLGNAMGQEASGDAEEEEEEPEADTDTESAELKQRLEHNLRHLKCIPPLYKAVLFLGFGHLTTLGWRFYAVMGGIICYSSAFYTFLAFGPKWLMTVYHMSEDEAGQTAGIIAIFSMIVSPSSGLLMDARGGQRYVCFGAMVSACIWFTIMGFAQAPPALCIVFAGMSYSLLPASLYPLLPEVVPAESFTIVYAVLNSCINLVFSIVLIIAGNVLGASTKGLEATRHVGSPGLLTDDYNPEDDVDPSRFKYIFSMFVTITFVGILATGSIAWDGYKNKTGWVPLTNKH